MEKVKLPIRRLVEFLLRFGDIDSRYVEKDRMLEGAKAHRSIQKANTIDCADYKSEVSLSAEIEYREIVYVIDGRADGIFMQDGIPVIDEIKTTATPLHLIGEDHNIKHWAQAECYAYLYASCNNFGKAAVQITYCSLDTGETKRFFKVFDADELKTFLYGLLEKYAIWAYHTSEWAKIRDASIKALSFPFPAFRKGQRNLAVYTYKAISGGKKLFAQAPTGTGKTISTLFPAVKALGEGKAAKIFYLTAKTITRQAAEEAFYRMRQHSLKFKTLTITAKDKICFCAETLCYPETCEYAKGHYDRINGALLDAITNCDDFNRAVVEEYAKKHRVCPFELSLDISLWADSIICDYNYVFDPRVYLRRFFAEGRDDYVFIVDEAHNLVDRAREMFSAELSKSRFLEIKKTFKGTGKPFKKALTAVNKCFLALKAACGELEHCISNDLPEELLTSLTKFAGLCDALLKENRELGTDNTFLSGYFEALNFLNIAELFNEMYVTFTEKRSGDVTIKLFCLDPSFLLGEAFKRGCSAILFSATLTPLGYFRDILSGGDTDTLVAIDTPFKSANLCVLFAGHISTRFKNRDQSISHVAELAGCFISCKKGNYIVYFPSYKYMHDVFVEFRAKYPEIHAFEQEASMTEDAREAFLDFFKEDPEQTMAAFCVLGGIFSEGIDLKGTRLIGAVIVGVGLPQLSVQQNIIKDYFMRKNGMGYEYAYMYPGMNKVLQAAGRVIRSESDRGAVLLIDERFTHAAYKNLFPSHWQHCKTIRDVKKLEAVLKEFWGLF